MKAAVLCPGPSLATAYKGRGDYDRVLGVNRGVWRDPGCDWWVATDDAPFVQLPMRWWTMRHTADILRGTGRTLTGGTIAEYETEWEAERVPYELGGASWGTFTSTAALVRAYLDGAKQIDVYGYDATNAADFDGANLPTNTRDAQRWEHEAAVWGVVTRWLAERGCEVRRIQP